MIFRRSAIALSLILAAPLTAHPCGTVVNWTVNNSGTPQNGVGTYGPYHYTISNVIYPSTHGAMTLQFCQPAPIAGQFQGPFPADLLIHGGGWNGGSAVVVTNFSPPYTRSPSWCQIQASWGIVGVPVGYRLINSADATTAWPAALVDVQFAMRYVRAHAATYNISNTLVGVEGDSAGATLGLQTSFHIGNVTESGVSTVNSSFSPNTDFMISQFGPWSGGPTNSAAPYASTDYANRVTAGLSFPPVMFVQGTTDTTVPPSNSTTPYCLLKNAGHNPSYMGYVGAHEFYPNVPVSVFSTIQMGVISFIYAQAHATGVLPTTLLGPQTAYSNSYAPASC